MAHRGARGGNSRGQSSNSRSPSSRSGDAGGERNDSVALSKYLSYLLRHAAEKEGLQLRSDGYARVDDVLKLPKSLQMHVDFAQIQAIVDGNDKKRFALTDEAGVWFIRANQGHSDARVQALELTPIESAAQLPNGIAVHGTYFDAWKTIKSDGLCRMSRNHIHFAIGEIGVSGVISGMRSSAQVLIYIDLEKALKAGIPLFRSSNDVVLSPGIGERGLIAPEYFLAVVRASDRKPFDENFPTRAPFTLVEEKTTVVGDTPKK